MNVSVRTTVYSRVKVIAVCVLMIPFLIYSQLDSLREESVYKSLDKYFVGRDYQKIRDTCDKYLAFPGISTQFKGRLLAAKATAQGYWVEEHEDDSYKDNNDYDYVPILKEIDSLYIEAGRISPENRITFYYVAYDFFNDQTDYKPKRYEDTIVKYGYRKEVEAFGVHADFFQGNYNWAGVELSLFYYQPFCRVGKKVNGRKKASDVFFPLSWNAYNVGFRKAIDNKSWALNLSPVTLSYCWIHVNPANFTYFNTTSGNSWGYCPEAGLKFWYLYINYSYNIAFKKVMRNYEQGMINIKIQVPVAKL